MLNANDVTKGCSDTGGRRLEEVQNFTLVFTMSDRLVSRGRNEHKSFAGHKNGTAFQLYRSSFLSTDDEKADGACCRLIAYAQKVRNALVYDPSCRYTLCIKYMGSGTYSSTTVKTHIANGMSNFWKILHGIRELH